MSKETSCNDGRCKINRKGEKHALHKAVSMNIDPIKKLDVKMPDNVTVEPRELKPIRRKIVKRGIQLENYLPSN